MDATLKDIMVSAIELFGSQEAAERWLSAPAMAHDGQRPIELVGVKAGVETVEDLQTRLEHGVCL